MFDTLVESGSHTGDLARKGSFFLGTMAIYAVLLIAVFVLSIYWYDARLESQTQELLTELAPPPQAEPEPEQPKPQEAPKQAPVEQQLPTRTEMFTNLDTTKPPDTTSVVRNTVPPAPPNAVRGKANIDPVGGAPTIGPTGGGPPAAAPAAAAAPPPPPPPKPEPPKRTAPISGGVLNGKAISKPEPVYPAAAKAARASGAVAVQITVDESGKVISAVAVSGHPLLRQAAVQAAQRARFSPTQLSGQAVKVTGTITYNFVLQ